MNLSEVTILISSFLRPGYLAQCVKSARATLPECKLVIADDSGDVVDLALYADAKTVKLDFDSGLSAKRNAGIELCEGKYVLLSHDDNDFSSPSTRAGIEKLLSVLEENPEIDLAAGRLDNRRYEGSLDYVRGSHIKEHRLLSNDRERFHKCDITGNYFLARTELLKQIRWDSQLKLHEHGDWFLSLMEAGKCAVWVPGVNGPCQRKDLRKQHPDYDRYRARKECHQLFMAKRGISEYFGFDQPVKLNRSAQPVPDPASTLVTATADSLSDIVIAIITCKKNRQRLELQQRTWIPELRALGYRIEIFDGDRLGVGDDYYSLPAKTKALCAWASAERIGAMLKIDDDGLINPRLFTVPEQEYCGMTLPANDMGQPNHSPIVRDYPRGTFPHRYCSGGAYWLKRTGIEIAASSQLTNDWAEDRWIGNLLATHGIRPVSLPGYNWVLKNRPAPSGWVVLTQVPETQALQIWSRSKAQQLTPNGGRVEISAAFAF